MTRPDLAWSYSELSKYVQFPGQAHMDAADHVLRYLRDMWDDTITYTRGLRRMKELWEWVAADWAGYTDTRRSHTGHMLIMNGGPISWKSRRQDKISLSTSKKEFIASSQAAQEVVYLRETLKDFGYEQHAATEIYEDNLACIAMNETLVCRKFSRHIDICRYFIRELVEAGIVKLIPLRTHKMVADALTKSLPSPAFIAHRKVILGHVSCTLKFLGSCRAYIFLMLQSVVLSLYALTMPNSESASRAWSYFRYRIHSFCSTRQNLNLTPPARGGALTINVHLQSGPNMP